MNDEFLIFESPSELSRWSKKTKSSPPLDELRARIILDIFTSHKYELMSDDTGKLFTLAGGTEPMAVTIDDVISEIGELNYDDIRQVLIERKEVESYDEYDRLAGRLDNLREVEKIIETMFDETSYGKKISDHMRELAYKTLDSVKGYALSDEPEIIPMMDGKSVTEDRYEFRSEDSFIPADPKEVPFLEEDDNHIWTAREIFNRFEEGRAI